ncbi:hypothetical protein K402DRAFT_406087 [Aulographum hederae CBS 113979]|uniref:Trichothecene 3-O-acetyltransferase-like N-terminal domain-containing protein n=1 Tax=Aulographum hederae CBS 113979 TaxID=1176131 RepID=A0A6G1GTW6_9PEZI|nr:hypothetical protein K402DRAFT_406087 [Aulographum hederae CBS 113979]
MATIAMPMLPSLSTTSSTLSSAPAQLETPATSNPYTRWLFCFPTDASTSETSIISTLQQALDRTTKTHPLITGKVSSATSASPTSFPTVDIRNRRLSISMSGFGPRILVKDWRKPGSYFDLTYAELSTFNMPLSEPEVDILSPTARSSQSPVSNVEYVMAAQLNLVPGGAILCVCIHASCAEATGHEAVLSTWAENARAIRPTEKSKRDSGVDFEEEGDEDLDWGAGLGKAQYTRCM